MTHEDRLPGLSRHPHVRLGHHPTPIDFLPRLGETLGLSLWAKRDDCNGLAFGGNKVRQLEYYLGPAVAQNADTVLITGALQSNFVRTTVAAANTLGMKSEVQLEERVPDTDALYRNSGNILLDQLLGATIHYFAEGENEAAADAELDRHAERLRGEGRKPYVIHLGIDHPPYGGLGYASCAAECLKQFDNGTGERPDVVVIPSGSALTHAGFLAGARACGWDVPVMGVCVRRDAGQQRVRVQRRATEILDLLGSEYSLRSEDVSVSDAVLAPGYGRMNPQVAEAVTMAARHEALLLDPVYTGRTMAGLIDFVRTGEIRPGSKVLFIHTGGGPALFAYQNKMATEIEALTAL
ncbi:MAG: D-cysteine desulfhydrase family protein [Pseudomonadota bacterium]